MNKYSRCAELHAISAGSFSRIISRREMLWTGREEKVTMDHNGASVTSYQDFKFLRSLDLAGCLGLTNHHLVNIERLFQLKYLTLRDTGVTELPPKIGELQHLHTLEAILPCRLPGHGLVKTSHPS